MKKILFLLLPLCSFSQTEKEREFIRTQSNAQTVLDIKGYYKEYMEQQSLLIEKFKRENKQIDVNVLSLQRIVDGQPVFFETDNATSVSSIRGNAVYPGGSLGLNVTGAGIYAGVWDGGRIRDTHQELVGRTFIDDASTSLVQHGTHVTGTIIAQGVNPLRRGFAYQGLARCSDWNNDINEMISFADQGYLVSNHSYGNNAASLQIAYFGNYNSQSREVDDAMNAYPYYQIVKSAGNDNGNTALSQYNIKGGYDLINGVSTAKNVLTVAATENVGIYNDASDVHIASFSNWGPTDDGRIKPDLAAKGVNIFSCNSTSDTAYTQLSGTSMAAPAITGSILLLQQHYHNLTPSAFMKAATVRGLLCHSTREAGLTPGPDYQFGWGLADVSNAAVLISGKGNSTILSELTLSNSQTFTRTFTINAVQDIKASIAWTDPTGFSNGSGVEDDRTPRLINNLDLKILKDGVTYYPWKLDPDNPTQEATNTGDNNVDNVEQVQIFNAAPGTYTIQVTHKAVLVNGSQDFSLIANGSLGLSLNTDDFVADNEFFVYPSPASEVLHFSNPNSLDIDNIRIVDISGKTVYENNEPTDSINISNLQSGVYFISFKTDARTFVKKFVKQ